MKYIITEHNAFAIFSESNVHKDVAQGLDGEPISAGFCNIRQESDSGKVNIHCYGESISLGIKSKETDEVLINDVMNS